MDKTRFTQIIQDKYPSATVAFDNKGKAGRISIHITFKPNQTAYTYQRGMIEALDRLKLIPLILPWQEAGAAVDDLLDGVCPTIHLVSMEATRKEWEENGQSYRPGYDIAFDQASMDEFARPTVRCKLVQRPNADALLSFQPNPNLWRQR